MDYELITAELSANKIIYEGGAEQPVDIDVTLPDYCPDIQRILKCSITPRIGAVQTAGDRVTAEGSALVRIIYTDDDGALRCYDQSFPLSKSAEIKGLTDSACVGVRARTDYANCRAVSRRRADVHGLVTLGFKASVLRDESIISGARGAGIQLRRKSINAAQAVGGTEKAFPMSETVELPAGKPAIAQLLRSDAAAVASDVKIINNKLLLKGELRVCTVYGANGEMVKFEHSMPISQIIEVDGVSEDCECDIRLSVSSLEVQTKSDGAGEQRFLDIGARVNASISAYKSAELLSVTDAYSTCCELKTEYGQIDFLTFEEKFDDSFVAVGSFDIGSLGAEKILDVRCGDVTSSAVLSEGELSVGGTAMLHIYYRDSDGQLGYAERQSDFEYRRRLHENCERVVCEPWMTVLGCESALGADGKITVRTELGISAMVFAAQSERAVVSMLPSESESATSPAALTIYFSDEGEEVWSIARRYNTTVEAVMQENGLDGESVPASMMLLIPRANR